jgi:nitrogen-specific signal transduction histidine kinase
MKKPRRKQHTSALQLDKPQSIAVLASWIADDFNNILTTVLGACTLIDKDDPANGELLQYVALIRASAERAVALSGRLVSSSAVGQKGRYLEICPQSADTSISDKKVIDGIESTKNLPGGAPS